MKQKIFTIICFMSLALLFSCSDWQKDPTEAVKILPAITEPTGVVMQTNFPKYMSAFCAKSNGIFLAGTSDGYFYKSNNYGKSWVKTGEMRIKDNINFLMAASTDNAEVNVISGTNKGGYLSTDFGTSWMEILPAESGDGHWRVITGGSLYFIVSTGYVSLYFRGFDGTYNSFYTYSNGNIWNPSYATCPILNGIEGATYSGAVTTYNNDSASAIKFNPNKVTYFKENMEIKSILGIQYASYSYLYLAGTKRGILLSSDYGTTWPYNYLKQYKIYSLASYGSQIYSATSGGLYISMNYGITWLKIELPSDPEPVINLFVFKSYMYVVAAGGQTYYFKIPDEMEQSIYVPILKAPENYASCDKSPKLLWVKMDDYNKTNYRLQISANTSFKSILIDTTIADNFYQTDIPKKETKYYWRVCSSKIWGASPWSEVWSFTVK